MHEVYGFWLAVFTFAIVFGAFAANVLYGAMRAVPHAQIETAEAYGMSRRQTFWRVLVPQMWVYALPGLSNLWMVLIKATPLLFLLGVEDIVYWARELGGTKTPQFTDYPHGDWRHVVFLRAAGLLPAVSPASPNCVLDRIMARLTTGQATMRRRSTAEGRGMSCWETIADYALRSQGIGERLLPRTDFTLCQQFTLIGSGMIWNIYFGVFALVIGLLPGHCRRDGQGRAEPVAPQARGMVHLRVPRLAAVHPVLLCLFPVSHASSRAYPALAPFTSAWLGALMVLFLNTAAYSAEIFYGALHSIPKGDTEAADAYGLSGWPRFRRIDLAHDAAAGLARLYQRGDLPVPRHHAGVLFGLSGHAASRATRSITPPISPTRPSTLSCPTRSWRGISSY